MALDSRNKRASIISLGRPFTPTLPQPDGSLATSQDRKHLVYRYRGDEDVLVAPRLQPPAWLWQDRRRHGAPQHRAQRLVWRWR